MTVKNQHYVPRFYLKGFTPIPKQIGMYNFKSTKKNYIPRSNLYNQCCSEYFYDKDNTVENALALTESKIAKLFSSIIEHESLNHLSTDDLSMLYFSMALQHTRTQAAVDLVTDLIQGIMKVIEPDEDQDVLVENAISLIMRQGIMSYPLFTDLRVKLLVNKTQYKFITSDHPVSFSNPFLEGKAAGGKTGTQQKGLVILYPVNSELSLCFYDSDVYHLGKNNEDLININSEVDILEHNKAIALTARDNFYFEPNYSKVEIEKIAKCRVSNAKVYSSMRKQKIDDGELLITSLNNQTIDFCLPGQLKVKKNKRKEFQKAIKRQHSMAVYMRNPELLDEMENFNKLVNQGKYSVADFLNYLSDYGLAPKFNNLLAFRKI